MISTMGYLFVTEGFLADPSITAIDRTLSKANGHVWHKSSMEKGIYHLAYVNEPPLTDSSSYQD